MSDSRSTRPDILGSMAAGVIVLLFCLVLLWHDPQVFWNDDYQLSILPVFADVARSWNEGHLPLLSPYSWVCGNLAGEFEYGTFSPFVNAAVVLILKLPLTFAQQAAALSITHLFTLASGAFLLARGRQLSVLLSIFVALVATLNGWIICWGATDWFGALGALTWLPWAWWALERAVAEQRDSASRAAGRLVWRSALLPVPVIYLLITGGFPYTIVMLLLIIAWLSIKSLVETRRLASIVPMWLGVTFASVFSAPAWLALLDHVHGSAREMHTAVGHFQWLVPPAAWPGLILPAWTVNWADFSARYLPHTATELACGLVAPAALIAGFAWRGRILVRRMKWELLLLVVVLGLAMLPTVGLFRWSFRWLPLFHLIFALCAAEALRIFNDGDANELEWRWPRSTLPAATAFTLVALAAIAMKILGTAGPYAFPLAWIDLGLAALWIIAEFSLRNVRFREWIPAGLTFGAFLATYLCIPTNCGVPRFNFTEKLLDPTPLDTQRLYLSIYPPPETDYRVEKKPGPVGQIVRPGNTPLWAGLHFINGYSPVLPAGVATEFKLRVHGEIDPEVGKYLLNEQAGADGKLALLGVDGIVVAQEIAVEPQPATEWQLVTSADEGRVFHRRGPPFARVRSLPAIDSRTGQQFSVATISGIAEWRNRVEADVDVPAGGPPALLVFSRPYFRGYKASLNGTKLTVESESGLCPVVRIPPGSRGRLTLEYRPFWLGSGLF